MSDEYKVRERVTLQQLAWSTLANHKSSEADRRAARARLEDPDDAIDVTKLSDAELTMLEWTLRRARGEQPQVITAEDALAAYELADEIAARVR